MSFESQIDCTRCNAHQVMEERDAQIAEKVSAMENRLEKQVEIVSSTFEKKHNVLCAKFAAHQTDMNKKFQVIDTQIAACHSHTSTKASGVGFRAAVGGIILLFLAILGYQMEVKSDLATLGTSISKDLAETRLELTKQMSVISQESAVNDAKVNAFGQRLEGIAQTQKIIIQDIQRHDTSGKSPQ